MVSVSILFYLNTFFPPCMFSTIDNNQYVVKALAVS